MSTALFKTLRRKADHIDFFGFLLKLYSISLRSVLAQRLLDVQIGTLVLAAHLPKIHITAAIFLPTASFKSAMNKMGSTGTIGKEGRIWDRVNWIGIGEHGEHSNAQGNWQESSHGVQSSIRFGMRVEV